MKSEDLYRIEFKLASENVYEAIVSDIKKEKGKNGFMFTMLLRLNENAKLLFSDKVLPYMGAAKKIISLRKINEKERQMVVENEI